MLTLEQAQQHMLQAVKPLPPVVMPLELLLGRTLAVSVNSPENVPRFDNSAMDGYAIALLPEVRPPFQCVVRGEIPAGHFSQQHLQPGEAARIMTGAPLPPGANAVVPIEDVDVLPEGVRVRAFQRPGQHIRRAGEEITAGAEVLRAGQVLNPAAIGLLATFGITQVAVIPPVRVGILATGNELVHPAQMPGPGQIRDSNTATVTAALQAIGVIPQAYGIAPDQRSALRAKLAEAIAANDVLLTLGGVSVGDYDYVQEELTALGFQKGFWKVAMKPGKPLLFGTLQGKPVFGIPGNPASTLNVIEQLVRPALRKMMGFTALWRPAVKAVLTDDLKGGDRLQMVRGVLTRDGDAWRFQPLPRQGSANLWPVSQANGVLPLHGSLAAGSGVAVQRTDQPEV
jgi:molybdopterin molybdotransferase